MSEAPFLFGEDVNQYIRTVREKFIELQMMLHEKTKQNNPDCKDLVITQASLLNWFNEQANTAGVTEVFRPYIEFADYMRK